MYVDIVHRVMYTAGRRFFGSLVSAWRASQPIRRSIGVAICCCSKRVKAGDGERRTSRLLGFDRERWVREEEFDNNNVKVNQNKRRMTRDRCPRRNATAR